MCKNSDLFLYHIPNRLNSPSLFKQLSQNEKGFHKHLIYPQWKKNMITPLMLSKSQATHQDSVFEGVPSWDFWGGLIQCSITAAFSNYIHGKVFFFFAICGLFDVIVHPAEMTHCALHAVGDKSIVAVNKSGLNADTLFFCPLYIGQYKTRAIYWRYCIPGYLTYQQ